MTQSEEIIKGIDIKHMRRRYVSLVAIIACAVVLFGNDMTVAREEHPPKPSEGFTQQFPSPDEQELIEGYPVRKRRIGGPTDVEWDLDNSFPKRGSVLELILQCKGAQQQ
jgi:hypothetical protein